MPNFNWDLPTELICFNAPSDYNFQIVVRKENSKVEIEFVFTKFLAYRLVKVVILVRAMGKGPDNLFPISDLQDFGMNR